MRAVPVATVLRARLKPADEYVPPATETTFAAVAAAALRYGETAIGYRRTSNSHRPPDYGVVINPDKQSPLRLEPDDKVIVLATS